MKVGPKEPSNKAKMDYWLQASRNNGRTAMLMVSLAGPDDKGEYVVLHGTGKLNAPQAALFLREVLASVEEQAVAGEHAAGPGH